MLSARRMTWNFVLALSMLCAPTLHADGPQTGTLEGKVLDASGSPLPGVTITLSGPQGQNTTTTGDDGTKVLSEV